MPTSIKAMPKFDRGDLNDSIEAIRRVLDDNHLTGAESEALANELAPRVSSLPKQSQQLPAGREGRLPPRPNLVF